MPLHHNSVAITAAIALHVGFLSWSVAEPPAIDRPQLELTPVELIELTDFDPQGQGELAPEAGLDAPERAEQPAAEPEPAPEPEPEPVPKPERRKRRPEPKAEIEPPPQPEPDGLETESPTHASAVAVPPPADVADAPAVDGDGPAPKASEEPVRPAASGQGHQRTAGKSGTGTPDHSAYGAEIGRLVNAEIDRDPVAGVTRKDGVDVLLRVLPSGRLARTGDGRLDVGDVLRSSLGPVRTRALLRRIKRASARFPPHPRGFRSRHYIVEVKLRFPRGAV